MKPGSKGYLHFAGAVATLALGLGLGVAQPGATGSLSPAQQAVHVVTRHYLLNPLALDPKTGPAIPHDGTWLIGPTRPLACGEGAVNCMEVIYQVPAESVRCAWTVSLNADGSDGSILDENDDAEHYLMRRLSADEGKTQVATRTKPVYPANALAAHVAGVVVLNVIVGKSGDMQQTVPASGPPMLQHAAAEAAKLWTFKPWMVGARAVPYTIQLKFLFRGDGAQNAAVDVSP